jgi:hypothetical protein
MITLEELRARPGESIAQKVRLIFRYLEQQVAAFQKMTGPGLLRDVTADGFYFRAIPQEAPGFKGAFQVQESGDGGFRVGFGLIDEKEPTIFGVKVSDASNPSKAFDGGAGEGLRSWVCVEARFKDGVPDAKEPYPVTHRPSLELDIYDDEMTGVLPLAMVQWREGGGIERIWQIVYFDQRTVIRPAREGVSSKVVFYPAS